jgi:hypothetical protein
MKKDSGGRAGGSGHVTNPATLVRGTQSSNEVVDIH